MHAWEKISWKVESFYFIYLFIQVINQQWHRSTSIDIEMQT